MQTGAGSATDAAIIRNLQQAITLIQGCIQEEIATVKTLRSAAGVRRFTSSMPYPSRQIRHFQDSGFLLFDQAFVLPDGEVNEVAGFSISSPESRKTWMELQCSAILFNLALIFHRRAHLRRQREEVSPLEPGTQHHHQCDEAFRSQTRLLFSKSNLLYGMAKDLVNGESGNNHNGAESAHVFLVTKFALRLGIANNIAHIISCNL